MLEIAGGVLIAVAVLFALLMLMAAFPDFMEKVLIGVIILLMVSFFGGMLFVAWLFVVMVPGLMDALTKLATGAAGFAAVVFGVYYAVWAGIFISDTCRGRGEDAAPPQD